MIFFPMDELDSNCKNAALRFVVRHEIGCVQLSSEIKKSQRQIYVVFVNDIVPRDIYGVVSLKKTFLHCLPFCSISKKTALQEDFENAFSEFLISEKIEFPLCVNGTFSGTKIILSVLQRLEKNPLQINEYSLFRLDLRKFNEAGDFELKNGEKIIRMKSNISASFREKLQRLQDDYEKEEVLPVFKEFNPDSSRLRLSFSLRHHCIFALADKHGNLLSKAGTNAIGFKCIQIGGVFTDKKFRGKKYAYILVKFLVKKILVLRKLPVLFVKKENIAANHLYLSLGFVHYCDYLIAYF